MFTLIPEVLVILDTVNNHQFLKHGSVNQACDETNELKYLNEPSYTSHLFKSNYEINNNVLKPEPPMSRWVPSSLMYAYVATNITYVV